MNKNTLNNKQIKRTFSLQQDQSDCGIACLQSLVKYYGGDISLENLREISGTNKQGTTLLGLYQAANKIGFTAEGNEADINAIIEHGEALILHVVVEENLEHYFVCYGFEKGKFIIGDPARGIVYYTKEELENVWKSKSCLVLKPNERFEKKKNIKKNKLAVFQKLIKDDYEILVISLVLGIVLSLLGMVMAVFTQKLIDVILPAKDLQKLFVGLGFVTLLLMSRAGLSYIRQFMLLSQSKDFNNRIIKVFYDSLLFLPKLFFDTRKIGELTARLNDTSRIQRVITQSAGNFIIDILVTITSTSFLFIYSWQSGLIAVVSFPIYFFIIYRYNSKIIDSQQKVMSAYAQSESNYISTVSGISTIKNFNRQDFFSELNKTIYGNFQDNIFKLGKINLSLGFISGIGSVVFIVSILAFTSYQTFNNTLMIGELTAILSIASTLIPSISNLALIVIPLNEAKVAFNRMYEFTNIEPESNNKTNNQKITISKIEIKNLSFRFSGRKQILKNVNIKLNKGKLVALAGESGSGKTTMGSILQKFYKPEFGNIIINNSIDLQSIETNLWRSNISVVPQDIHLFNGNVIYNICLDESEEETKKVLDFLNETGFAKYIDAFPQSFMTLLGEEGANISGGQKQIIALARALYRKPQILILDEASSAMDRETEQFTSDLLLKIKTQTSILLITHRLHILKKIADTIYILEKGKIQTFGTHKELMKSKNLYSSYQNEISQST